MTFFSYAHFFFSANVLERLAKLEQKLGATEQKLEATQQDLEATQQDLGATKQDLGATKQKLGATEQKLEATEQKLEATQQDLGATKQALEATKQEVEASRLFDGFIWTEDHRTLRRSAAFVENVLRFYNARDDCNKNQRWCLVLGRKMYNVSVAHLFKHAWHEHISLVGLDSIDDVRNGLPMFTPIEWAFDTSRLCFYIPDGSDKLTVKLLDKGIANTRLYQKGQYLCGAEWHRRQPAELSSMTFGDLDKLPLTFDNRDEFALKRPFMRILCLHAKAARRQAIRKLWMREGEWEFSDFSSEGLSVSEKIRAWK